MTSFMSHKMKGKERVNWLGTRKYRMVWGQILLRCNWTHKLYQTL